MVTEFIFPKRILSAEGTADALRLCERRPLQPSFKRDGVVFNGGSAVLDFGREYSGGLRLVTGHISSGSIAVRVRFGESLSEANSEPGEKNSGNDHAVRDFPAVRLPSMAATDVGDTGFRFVRIDFPPGVCVELTAAAAVYRHCGLTATGTFGCDDARVNEIFSTAARTLYLNMQNGVIWDGIKRDRLVWAGDLHPEILTSLHLFGGTENAKNSLAMCAADAPDGWINGIPAYSMWWMLSVCEYYRYTGDEAFVSGLLPYLIGTLDRLKGAATDSGLQFGGDEMAYFLDWNSFGTKEASAGVHALAIASARRAADLLAAFGKEADISALTGAGIVRAALSGDGTAARAFAYLAGMNAPSVQSAAGMSCFTSLYVLSAMAGQGRGKAALSGMKTFFGGMLDAGATTFWEAFDPVWTAGAGRIDEMSAGDDVHGDRGRHCYTGFRNSLCHGWASSPVPFLHRRVLGIRPVTAGRVELRPDLCGLRRAEGTVPTPFGPLSVCVTAKGTEYEAPAGLTVTVPDENKGN